MAPNLSRGKPLLAVMIRSTRWLVILWSVIVVYVMLVLIELVSKGTARVLSFLGVLAPLLAFVAYPRVRFFEGGVEIPPTQDVNRRRFLRWDQIDRYSWDGDRLVLSGTSSVLAGGPVEGDVLAIPTSKRDAVEQILVTKMARS